MGKRFTTQEVAALLERRQAETLMLLKAARIPHDRLGRGAYLWHAEGVERLLSALGVAAPSSVSVV